MKKSILAFCLAGGMAANAQNNDLQDLNKIIKERKEETGETNRMKLLAPLSTPLNSLVTGTPYILPNGDKVYEGSLDRMPIVKPDMQAFSLMPNTGHAIDQFRTMPNPGRNRFKDLGATGPTRIMDQIAPSTILDKLLKDQNRK